MEDWDILGGGPPPLRPSSTLELDDGDVAEQREAGSPPPPPPPRRVEVSGAGPLPRSPAGESGVRPLPGRVAYPIDHSAEPSAPSTLPREVDELAVAGEPPSPPRKVRPLTSQTASLDYARKATRTRRWPAVAAVMAALAGGAGLFFLLGHRGSPEGSRGALEVPDARSVAVHVVDARPTPPPDAAPPVDGPALGTDASPQPRPAVRSDGGVPDGVIQTADAASPDRGAPRPRARPAASVSPERAAGARRLYEEGLQQLLQGRAEEAVGMFRAALASDPGQTVAFRGLGLAYERLGKPAEARAAYGRYLRRVPRADDAAAIRQRIERLK
ncbi:MAG: tetratricopeptide repeat protein [Deltaproteobacteria bacterium]|nr:tetratricopeptide repeat protein [Deltaproteobacteria bacterium]